MSEEIKEFLLKYTETEDVEITPDASLTELGIDSLKLCEIIADFEKQFNVKVSDKQLGNLFTVKDLIDIVSNR